MRRSRTCVQGEGEGEGEAARTQARIGRRGRASVAAARKEEVALQVATTHGRGQPGVHVTEAELLAARHLVRGVGYRFGLAEAEVSRPTRITGAIVETRKQPLRPRQGSGSG